MLYYFSLNIAQYRPFKIQFFHDKNNLIFSVKKKSKKIIPYRPNIIHILELPGPYITLGFSWISPAPQYLKYIAALIYKSRPLSYITNKKPAVSVGELIAGVGG